VWLNFVYRKSALLLLTLHATLLHFFLKMVSNPLMDPVPDQEILFQLPPFRIPPLHGTRRLSDAQTYFAQGFRCQTDGIRR